MTWQQRKKLLEERAKLIADMKAMLDKANEEKRDLTEEQSTQFDEMSTRSETIQSQVRRYDHVIAAENAETNHRDGQQQRAGREDLDGEPQTEQPDTQESLDDRRSQAFDAYLRGGFEYLDTEERSLLVTGRMPVQGERRALTTGGIGVVGTRTFSNELIKAMRNYTGVLEAGARTMTTSNGNELAMLTVDDTANEASDEKAQGSAADDDVDPNFGNKTIGAYTYDSGVVLVPWELLQDSAVDLGAEILDLASERIGVKLNKRTTTGTGTGQPQGFVTAAGVGKTTAATAAFTYEELVDLFHSVSIPYRKRGGVWQMNDQTLAAVRKLKDGDGRYIFAAGMPGQPNMVLGKPYVVNPEMDDIAAGNEPIAFGDFTRYRVRFVANPFVRRLTEAYATKRSVGFYIAQRADGVLTDARAIKKLKMAAT